MQNIVNAINLLTKALKCVKVSPVIAHFYYYLVATAGTTITAAGTFYKIAGTTNLISGDKFTHSNNKVVYGNGGTGINVMTIHASLSFISNTNNVTVQIAGAINGVVDTKTVIERKVGTGADVGHLSAHMLLEVEEGDYFEMFATCDVAGAILTAQKMVLIGK